MKSLKDLKHTVRNLPTGEMVMVLDTGAVITPEAAAMLQALHSRSADGVYRHLEVLAERGAERFMESFYVGYGHKSIGDCGATVIFIEGVSMLAAKAIQDTKLYNGQEASTRYIPFGAQWFADPIGPGRDASTGIGESFRRFYLKAEPIVIEHLKKLHPLQEGEKEKDWEKAIFARKCDILRGFLPAGCTTNLAWFGTLRQVADRLLPLRRHPLEEVRRTAEAIEDALKEAHPSSFNHKRYPETEGYYARAMSRFYYFAPERQYPEFERVPQEDALDRESVKEYGNLLANRPPKTELPAFLDLCGTMKFRFLLDFGSFRDIQRHRAVYQRMPLLTTGHGFEEWYIDNLPEELKIEAQCLLRLIEGDAVDMNGCGITQEIVQYYIPMGYKVPNELMGTIPALVYLIELRATRFVHQTLRVKVEAMAASVKQEITGCGVNLQFHLDPEPGRFDVRRGQQDIVLKD